MKITIEIERDEDGIFWLRSKRIKCSYPIGKDLNILKSEVTDLIEEWSNLDE
jgi:hypothetical protein